MSNVIFVPDSQMEGFESLKIQQPDDHEGEVACTIVRMKKENRNPAAVLQVHGFNDYCFHAEAAQAFDQHEIDWYGLDLRKSGRSILPHQTFNGLRSMDQYFEDIHAALRLMKEQGAKSIVLMGHSLGGLAVSLFAQKFDQQGLFDAIILNSPFFAQNKDVVTKYVLVPLVSALAQFFPTMPVPGGFSKFYGPSLHRNDYGEWDYNLQWKPHIAPFVNAAWVRAVYHAQQKFWKGISIQTPVLLIYADSNINGRTWKEEFHYADAVININDIRKGKSCIHAPLTVMEIPGAKHDLLLSKEPARKIVYNAIFEWLRAHTSIINA